MSTPVLNPIPVDPRLRAGRRDSRLAARDAAIALEIWQASRGLAPDDDDERKNASSRADVLVGAGNDGGAGAAEGFAMADGETEGACSRREAGRLLGVSLSTIKRMLRDKELTRVHVRGRVMVSRAEIASIINARPTTTEAPR